MCFKLFFASRWPFFFRDVTFTNNLNLFDGSLKRTTGTAAQTVENPSLFPPIPHLDGHRVVCLLKQWIKKFLFHSEDMFTHNMIFIEDILSGLLCTFFISTWCTLTWARGQNSGLSNWVQSQDHSGSLSLIKGLAMLEGMLQASFLKH